MPSLQISALGSPEIRLDDKRVSVKPKKAQALLIYLAVAGGVQARDTLATLLWPDSGQRQARAALRRRLSELTGAIGDGWLHTDGEAIGLAEDADLVVDLSCFEQELAACRTHGHAPDEVCPACQEPLEAAVNIYRDDFLAGFTLSGCPEFDDWQFFRAESLRQELASALERLVDLHSIHGDPNAAIPHARCWIALDPLHEPAHRSLMHVYDAAGQRSAALRQYGLCVRTLDAEMGVPPEAETTDLYETIYARQTATPDTRREAKSTIVSQQESTASPESPADTTPLQDEVRMASVLALDVDAADEEEWDWRPDEVAERISAFMGEAPQLLARYEAYVTHTHDNGFQVLFGLPELHEDDAERAVHSAFTLQQSARKRGLAVAAGVTIGMVYVSRAHNDCRPTASGRTFNLALRLEGQAPRDSILVGAETYHQTEQAFRYTPYTVENRSRTQSITVHEAVRPRRHTVKSRGIGSLRAPLIGRDDELTKLTATLDKTRQGEGQLVTLVGEAGLGKSRLVAELKAAALDHAGEEDSGTVLWLEGRCLEMMQSVAYWPFVDILQTSFGWMPHTPETERAQQVASTLDEFMHEQRLTQEQVDIMGPILGRLLSLHYGNEWDERLQSARPEQIRHQTFETLRDFSRATAQRQPLVLVLEDLHWTDPLSIDLTTYLMEMLAATPLLLLCVYRPEAALKQDRLAQVALRKCPALFTDIRLRELTPTYSRTLIEALLHVEGLSIGTKNRILDTCQGNPFFLEEVIHDLIEADLIHHDGKIWRARQEIETTAVPTRVQSVILARYDRLDIAQKQTLQHAAVIGRLFSEQVLASAIPQDVDVDDALEKLEERAFIYPERTVPDVVYSFRHVLTQEAVYQTIPGQRRAALHKQVGVALETLYGDDVDEVIDQLAYHFDRSNVADKAIEYLLRAGDKAARAYLTDEAVAYYQRALEHIDALDADKQASAWRFHALSELGTTNMRSSRYEGAETYLRQAIAWGKGNGLPVKEVVRLHWWLGDLLMNWRPRYEETLQTGVDGLAMLDKQDRESAEAAMMYSMIAFGYYFRRDEQKFQKTTAHLGSFLQELPYVEEFRVCYGCILDACINRRDMSEFMRWLDIAEDQVRRRHDDWSLGEHLWTRGSTINYTGSDLHKAKEAVSESLSLFERVGDAKRVNWAEVSLCYILYNSGQSSQAEAAIRATLPSTYEYNPEHVVDVLLMLAVSCLAQCKWIEAADTLFEALQQMQARQQNSAEVLVLLGFVALGRGEHTRAAERFAEALHALDDPDLLPHRWRKWSLMVNSFFANTLYGLECTLDDAEAFRTFCRDFRSEHPASELAVFQHWCLEPVEPRMHPVDRTVQEKFNSPLSDDWVWRDPDAGCSFEVYQGLTVRSPVMRDLLFPMLNAPRMMRAVEGEFAVQVTCEPTCADRPGIGGILLWQDKHKYLRLSIGVRAQDEMSLEGCIDDRNVVIGRGRFVEEPVTLRMERFGDRVRALCSTDCETWYSVGDVAFPAAEDEQVGLHAIGFPDRTIYHEPYLEGTAVRFTDFCLWN